MTAYDLYSYLNAAIEFYLDSIAIKEDPTDEERTQYEYLDYWKPSQPDIKVEKILKSIVLVNKGEQKNESKE